MSNPGGKRYRIERTLGEGTYGKVKLAYDNYTREKVIRCHHLIDCNRPLH